MPALFLHTRIDGVSDYLESTLVGEQATQASMRTEGSADDEDRAGAVSVGVGLGSDDRDGCRSRSVESLFQPSCRS